MQAIARQEWQKDNFLITTDLQRMNLNTIHHFVVESYWAKGIPRELLEKSLAHSLCFGLFEEREQIGFARVVSDYATFAFLGDVFILPDHQGRGLSKWLMECIMSHPELQGLRRFCLGTKDAQGLYEKFGFQKITEPSNWMEIKKPTIYQN